MKALITVAVALVTICSLLNEVRSANIRFLVDVLDKSNASRGAYTTLSEKPCKDGKLNSNELKEIAVDYIKNRELVALNKLRPQTTFYSSLHVKEGIEELLIKKVVGTDHSPLEFIKVLLKAECTVYILGGSVRDILTSTTQQVKDIDIDTSCDIHEVKELCEQNFDKKYCFIHVSEILFQFGSEEHEHERLDIATNKETFGTPKLTCVEYSSNALAFEYGIDYVVVDFTGISVSDACTKQIRIPVAREDMDDWGNERGDYRGRKVFRYWKMRAKGYTKGDDETEEYVIRKAKEYIQKDDWIEMKKYYCFLMYGIMALIENNEGCDTTIDMCKDQRIKLKADNFKKVVAEDLGEDWKLPRCGKAEWGL